MYEEKRDEFRSLCLNMEHDNIELYRQFLSASRAITGSRKGVDKCLYRHADDEGKLITSYSYG
jgi:hypothetical protein